MLKVWTDQELDALVDVLESSGIATRLDNPNLDSRNSRNIERVLKERGYNNFIHIEEGAVNDYTCAVYNTEYYDDAEAREYLKNYILGKF